MHQGAGGNMVTAFVGHDFVQIQVSHLVGEDKRQ